MTELNAILAAARALAKEHGYANLTRGMIAKELYGDPKAYRVRHVLQSQGWSIGRLRDMLRDEGVQPGIVGPTTAKCPEAREAAIIRAGLELAREKGLTGFQRQELASRAGVSLPNIAQRVGSLEHVRTAVLRAAADDVAEWADVLAQGLATRHPVAMGADPSARAAAAASLAASA